MKKTILYISDTEKDIVKYLESSQRYLEGHEILCSLDKKNRILKTQNYDIVGKNIFGNLLGTGYGYCAYYCFSDKISKFEYFTTQRERMEEILMHVRKGAKEISGYGALCMIAYGLEDWEIWNIKKNGTLATGAV